MTGRATGGCAQDWETLHCIPICVFSDFVLCLTYSKIKIVLNTKKKIGNRIAIRPSNNTSGIHIEETRIQRDTCTLMFMEALFIIARTWKQPRCPPADE